MFVFITIPDTNLPQVMEVLCSHIKKKSFLLGWLCTCYVTGCCAVPEYII